MPLARCPPAASISLIDKVAAMKKIEPVEDAWERHFDPAKKLMVVYRLKDCPVR